MCKKRLKLLWVLLVAFSLSSPVLSQEALSQEDLNLMTRTELESIVLIYDKALIQAQTELKQNKQNWLNLQMPLTAVQTAQNSQAEALTMLSQQLEKYETQQKKDKISDNFQKVLIAVSCIGTGMLIEKLIN